MSEAITPTVVTGASAEERVSPAERIRNIVMASFLGEQYKLKENIKEVWFDKKNPSNVCLRINGIFYDIAMITDKSIVMVKEGLSSKPSTLSVVLGRIVEGDTGESVTTFEWEKVSEDIKEQSQRTKMTGDYKSADGLLQIMWGEDMSLLVSSVQKDEEPIFVRVTHGVLNEEYSKVFKSAVDAYLLRCNKKLNPQEPKPRKPRTPKEVQISAPSTTDTPTIIPPTTPAAAENVVEADGAETKV